MRDMQADPCIETGASLTIGGSAGLDSKADFECETSELVREQHRRSIRVQRIRCVSKP